MCALFRKVPYRELTMRITGLGRNCAPERTNARHRRIQNPHREPYVWPAFSAHCAVSDRLLRSTSDQTNVDAEAGPHGKYFGDKLQRTQFLGLGVPHGLVWQAKSALSLLRTHKDKADSRSNRRADEHDARAFQRGSRAVWSGEPTRPCASFQLPERSAHECRSVRPAEDVCRPVGRRHLLRRE